MLNNYLFGKTQNAGTLNRSALKRCYSSELSRRETAPLPFSRERRTKKHRSAGRSYFRH